MNEPGHVAVFVDSCARDGTLCNKTLGVVPLNQQRQVEIRAEPVGTDSAKSATRRLVMNEELLA